MSIPSSPERSTVISRDSSSVRHGTAYTTGRTCTEKAIGYARVSTDSQATEGVSLDAQRARIEAWCAANGYELVGLYVDAGLSGGRADNRPELQRALAEVCRLKGCLVVYSLSRLARSTKDTIAISERLDRANADLVSLSERIDTTSAAGRMIFRMLAVLAEFERDQIKERTVAAMSHLRRQQKRISGTIPFGYDLGPDGKSLAPNRTETAVLSAIQSQRASGASYREIAATLNASGTRPKIGAEWYASSVRAVLLAADRRTVSYC